MSDPSKALESLIFYLNISGRRLYDCLFFCPFISVWNVLSEPTSFALCTLSAICCIKYKPLYFLLNLPPAEHDIISSSSSPREQNVALGVKLFNYSVSDRLANLTISHLAPWTHQWYVCLHIRVCTSCVGYRGCCVSAHRELHSHELTVLQLVFMHAVVLCESHLHGNWSAKQALLSLCM